MKDFDSKLIPIIREGIEIIRMILFKEIQRQVRETHSDQDPCFLSLLTGAVLNEIFSRPNPDEPFASFRTENRVIIEQEIASLAAFGTKILIPLTDTLRMQAICDRIESGGDADNTILRTALEKGLLLTDRDLPLPHSFLDMVRRLGSSKGLVIPPNPENTSQYQS